MHCCWEGVTAQLKKLWFHSTNHLSPWYIGNPTTVAKINKKIANIQVPHNFRKPPLIDSTITWKGNYIKDNFNK